MDAQNIEQRIKEKIRSIPDYPKKGIIFRDITPLLRDKDTFNMCIDAIAEQYNEKEIDYIAGIEARGFIIGAALAHKLGKGFIPIRKEGKLPFGTISETYELEYGKETLQIHVDALKKGEKVLVVDDLIATGGTANAACKLVERLGGNVVGVAFIIELESLNGRTKLGGRKVVSLVKF